MVFAYATLALAFQPVNFEWVLLSLVTVLMVSRIDSGISESRNAVTLSDTFIFISVLLYGTNATVVLAGLEAAACTLVFKGRRGMVLFNAAAMSLSIFLSSTAVTLTFGELRPLASDLSRLVPASAMLALIHLALNSVLKSVSNAVNTET